MTDRRLTPRLVLLIALSISASLLAQSPATSSFEVASIKPSNPNASGILGAMPMAMPPSGGRFTGQNLTLRLLLVMSYDLQDFQVVGGPNWQTSDKFDIVAKAENPNATMVEMRPMLKALLADRFKLKAHVESREMPIYALVLARSDGRLGENIKPSTADCGDPAAQQQKMAEALAKGGTAAQDVLTAMMNSPCGTAPWLDAPGGFGMKFNGQPLSTLTAPDAGDAADRARRDRTQRELRLSAGDGPAISGAADAAAGRLDADGGTARIRQPGAPHRHPRAARAQAGFASRPVDVLVIDSVEKPTPD